MSLLRDIARDIPWGCSDLARLSPLDSAVKVLGEIKIVRQRAEAFLDQIMDDPPPERDRWMAIIKESLVTLDASEMRLRRLVGSRDGEFSDMGSN